MELFNYLSDKEQDMIKDYITNYAREDKNCSRPIADLDYILRVWDFHKLELFRLFGNKLIISKGISYKKEREDIDYEFANELFKDGSPGSEFVSAFYRLLYNNDTFNHGQINRLESLLWIDTLYENIYAANDLDVPLPSGKIYKLKAGTKAMRALGKIAKEFDLPGFEEFRIAHSQILNQKTINGTLYLSIHPLDFMTMSDNNCDWDSCMSWVDGEYKQGTVEMMNSDCVIVAYITNEHEDFWFSNKYSWNNKRWRELFIVDRGLITGIKGYPYENNDIEKIVCKWLKELAEINLGWNYNDEYTRYIQRQIIDNTTMPFYVHFKTHKMYNDFHSRERYGFFNPDYIMIKIKNTNRPDRYHLVYSGLSECMWCGGVISDISSYSLICDNCNETIYCDHCHCELIDPDSYVYVKETGQYFCEDCYEYVSSFECALCHDTIRAYPTTTLDIANLDENLIVICEYRQSICSSCLEKLQKRNAIILVSSTNTPDFFRLAIDWSKLTDEEKKGMFGWTPNDNSWLDSIDVLNYRPFGSITYEIAQVKKYDSEFPF